MKTKLAVERQRGRAAARRRRAVKRERAATLRAAEAAVVEAAIAEQAGKDAIDSANGTDELNDAIDSYSPILNRYEKAVADYLALRAEEWK